MSALLPFGLSVLALLVTPGPTNTLLAAAGAARGVRGSLALMPAELAGYALAIGAVTVLAGPALAASPLLAGVVKLAAGVYLARSALALWRRGGAGGSHAPVCARRVFATTLLNPKALVFAVAVFPGVEPGPAAALFAAILLAVASGWIALGAGLGRAARGRATPARISRAAAVAQGAFAALVAGSALMAAL